ncbi:MAG: glycosyltransferase [Betaproteobacteria bacterium]|nr:glycosyltransferase [Betaproteobacteria bacterium]
MSAEANARTVWIGLPAYNEEATIPALFPRFKDVFADSPANYRIVLYNDGCTDRTVERAHEWQGRLNVEIIGKPVNHGLGEGLRCLIEHVATHGAAPDVMFIMDCDDTHHPRQFAPMLAALDHGADVVIASRYRAGASTAGVAPHRQFLSLGAATLFKLLHWCHGVRDYTCGFRGYRVALLQQARARYGARLIEERGFACMVELLLKLNRIGAKMAEIPLELRYDLKQSASKMDVGGNTTRLLRKLVTWRVRGFK